MTRAVVLVTDFGWADPWVAELKGVLHAAWARWPAGTARPVVIDGGHDIPRGDQGAGAWFLQRLAATFTPGTVFLAVVDPGVGSGRAAVACSAGGQIFVGPAGPLLGWLSGADDLAVAVLDHALHRGAPGGRPVSATFHGRDVFAPAAAQLAMGVPLDQVGAPAAAEVLDGRQPPAGGWTVRWIDRFGNAITDLRRDSEAGARIAGGGAVRLGPHLVHGPAVTYAAAPPGVPFWYWGSGGTLEVAVRDASAAAQLDLQAGLALLLPGP